MHDRAREREVMVAEQLAARGIRSRRVLDAMRAVPRHRFVPPEAVMRAYDDRPLPIGLDQTISQPYMVALMTELLDLDSTDRVLEIGTGSGYQTAVLAELCAEVVTIERHPALHGQARDTLGALGYAHIELLCADGTVGHPPRAPYDAILVTAGSPQLPPLLLEQLGEGGRLVCPVGNRQQQRIMKVTRQGNALINEEHTTCLFVPLTGQDGWPEQKD
jgi:protein-L-isoaspartate(D-aspartate) O-methyltransferase